MMSKLDRRTFLPFLLSAALVGCGVELEDREVEDEAEASEEAELHGGLRAPRIDATQLLVAIEGGGAVMLKPSNGAIVRSYATGPNAFGALFSPDGSRAFVTDKDQGTLVEIDPDSSTVLSTTVVGKAAQQPAMTSTGRLYVPLSGGEGVAIVDVSGISPTVLTPLSTGTGSKPHIVSISPDEKRLWATIQGIDSRVASWELTSQGEGARSDARYDLVPRVLAATNDGAWFTAHHSTGLHFVRGSDHVSTTPFMDVAGAHSEARKQIEGVSVSSNGAKVIVTHEGRRALIAIGVKPDGSTYRSRTLSGLSHNPYWTTIDPSGQVAYVSIPGSGTVEAYDLRKGARYSPVWTAQVGGKPKRMALTTAP